MCFRNIEEILAERGEAVRTESSDDGALEFLIKDMTDEPQKS